MDKHLMPTSGRGVGIGLGAALRDLEPIRFKDRLHHIGPTRCALAEFAMAHGHADRIARYPIAEVIAQAAAFVFAHRAFFP